MYCVFVVMYCVLLYVLSCCQCVAFPRVCVYSFLVCVRFVCEVLCVVVWFVCVCGLVCVCVSLSCV